MPNDQKELNQKLNKELKQLTFTKADIVIKKTHPKDFQEKFQEWWNKEVSVPLFPVGVASIVIITASIVPPLFQAEVPIEMTREIVQVGGNFYWSDLFERVSQQ